MATNFPQSGFSDLAGKGFVVLGTGAGIGGDVCEALSSAGATLLCVDQSLEQAERAAAAAGGSALAADITKRSDMEAVFAAAEERFGDAFYGVVDVVGVPIAKLFTEFTDDEFDRQFDLVLRHAWLTISIAGPALAKRGAGSMVFIGSTGGFNYFPGVGMYCTAKAALHALVRNAAVELAPTGVRLNTVAPGRIANSGVHRPQPGVMEQIAAQIPQRRLGNPSEIAKAVLYLASDLSSYVTGETLVVDGGMLGMTSMPNPKPA